MMLRGRGKGGNYIGIDVVTLDARIIIKIKNCRTCDLSKIECRIEMKFRMESACTEI